MTKFAVCYGFGHNYCRNPKWKTSRACSSWNPGSLSKCSQLKFSFYSYYFDRCSSELDELVLLAHSRGSSTHYSNRLHYISVIFPGCFNYVYVNSFFSRTPRPWNSLPAECFPLAYDLIGYKSGVNSHLFSLDSFKNNFPLYFHLFNFLQLHAS